MEKFQNKYRIPSARAQFWDYRWAGAYFITICTKNRIHYFGEIENGTMILSNIGESVKNEWLKTPQIRPDMNLELGEFVVMPNHFHAILIIGENEYNHGGDGNMVETQCIASLPQTPIHDGGAMHCTSTPNNQFGPQRKNVASIIRGYKSSVTKYARMTQIDFEWQTRYYDHIIRNEKSFQTISEYIINNPANWDKDKFYGEL
jgi:putative transposase